MPENHFAELSDAVLARNGKSEAEIKQSTAYWWTIAECRCGGWWVLRSDDAVRTLVCPTLDLPAFQSS